MNRPITVQPFLHLRQETINWTQILRVHWNYPIHDPTEIVQGIMITFVGGATMLIRASSPDADRLRLWAIDAGQDVCPVDSERIREITAPIRQTDDSDAGR